MLKDNPQATAKATLQKLEKLGGGWMRGNEANAKSAGIHTVKKKDDSNSVSSADIRTREYCCRKEKRTGFHTGKASNCASYLSYKELLVVVSS